MYLLPSIIKVPLSVLRKLEIHEVNLFDAKKDRIRVFTGWIYDLETLTSVSRLALGAFTSSANAVASLVRAFPSLTEVIGRSIRIPARNNVALRDEVDRPVSRRSIQSHPLYDAHQLWYPVLHAPPALRSVKWSNIVSDDPIELGKTKGWLHPSLGTSSLKILHMIRCYKAHWHD